MPSKHGTITLGGGCFWCLEAIYQRVKGVDTVISGYAGGTSPSPNYNNHGDHAEVVQLVFNPAQISLETILEIFWYMHDPTTLNRQGADIGVNYRSIILYTDDTQKVIIEKSLNDTGQKLWDNPIVTEVTKLETFYKAEDYHQDFYNSNPNIGYCQVVINPKLAKFNEKFQHLLRSE